MTPETGGHLHYRDAMQPDEAGIEQLAKLIRAARKRRGWTQKDLAEETGVSVETIKRYENGKILDPKRDLVRAITEALHIDQNALPITLGLIPRGTSEPPPEARRRMPLIQRIIDALEDPTITDGELDAIASLLDARRTNPKPPRRNRKAG